MKFSTLVCCFTLLSSVFVFDSNVLHALRDDGDIMEFQEAQREARRREANEKGQRPRDEDDGASDPRWSPDYRSGDNVDNANSDRDRR